MSIVIFTDGGSRGNPGKAGVGVVIQDGASTLKELGKYLGDGLTNNYAEYQALILGLSQAKDLGLTQKSIEVRMDSELIVKQMQGLYKVKDPGLKVQHAKVRELLSDFSAVTFRHIPREENADADRLVNEVIDAA